MEQNNTKFRLRLNLFDAVILIAVLLVGAALIWLRTQSSGEEAASPAAQSVQYTIRFQLIKEGNGALVQPGDQLIDTVKNYHLGTVVSTEIVPSTVQVLNQETRRYEDAVLEGYEDVLVTVASTCTDNGQSLILDSGYDFRVGQVTYVRGPGYMGSGPVVDIQRPGEAGSAGNEQDGGAEQ